MLMFLGLGVDSLMRYMEWNDGNTQRDETHCTTKHTCDETHDSNQHDENTQHDKTHRAMIDEIHSAMKHTAQ